MKIMKKISAIVLGLCLCISCFSMTAHAEDGRISFTDPETAVGEMVEVRCVLRSTGVSMGEVEVQLDYDSEYLSFQSGDGVEDADGTLTYQGTGGSSEISFTMEFQALKEGETKLTIASASVASDDGTDLMLTEGNSTVKVAAGDPSKILEGTESETTTGAAEGEEVEVNGVTYTLTDAFADADIPSGYSKTTLQLDGGNRQMVTNESGAVILGYLVDDQNQGDFFLYNVEDATFAPYEEIVISNTTSIIVLSDTSEAKLPKQYKAAKLTLNEKEFPVWQDSSKEDTYIIYAMNNEGEPGYYQYDSKENTYQRVNIEAEKEKSPEKKEGFLGKAQDLIEKNLFVVVLIAGLLGILILVLLIVLGVKLHNRNAELDDLYDEYGIDEEEIQEPAKVKAPKKAAFVKRPKEEDEFETYDDEDFDDFEDDFDDYTNDFVKENDFEEEDDFEEEIFDDKESLEEDQFDTIDLSGFDEEFTGYTRREDLTIDDLDELLSDAPKKRYGHEEDDDTFKVDFIDLD